jgi:hypothetical protein
MTALQATTRHSQPPGKLIQIARHRVLRWFRPSEVELRRARLQPHPIPATAAVASSNATRRAKESTHEQHA